MRGVISLGVALTFDGGPSDGKSKASVSTVSGLVVEGDATMGLLLAKDSARRSKVSSLIMMPS
jgi:hypothetical protein